MADLFDEKNISPMLLYESEPFDDPDCIFELKLDGIRCIAYVEPNSVVLQNKRHKDVTHIYPELGDMRNRVSSRVILDGELVSLKDGKPDFYALQKRSLMANEFKIENAARRAPVQFVAYDILYENGKPLCDLPLIKRKARLASCVKEGGNLSVSRFIEERGVDFFNLAKSEGLEGVVAKTKSGKYHIGMRTRDWLKIKVMQDEDLLVAGFTNDERGRVKDLILAYYDEGGTLKCRGKVYLGVSASDRKAVSEFARTHTVETPHFDKYSGAVWITPQLVGTAQFMHATVSGHMRQPVFKGLRYDKVQ